MKPSSKTTGSYSTVITLSKISAHVLGAQCNCKAGAGGCCEHVAALFQARAGGCCEHVAALFQARAGGCYEHVAALFQARAGGCCEHVAALLHNILDYTELGLAIIPEDNGIGQDIFQVMVLFCFPKYNLCTMHKKT